LGLRCGSESLNLLLGSHASEADSHLVAFRGPDKTLGAPRKRIR
jgi:hypothetical protein